ncbi:MAG: glycosyltransferase family A protein [Thermodesulfobacteriota bacterium]|jgi:glycosyltransferase involved in cell wall biosynthesis
MRGQSVAVIIPCYNSSKYIRKTLDSVLNQNYKDLIIVAIDDGSKDETKKI